MVPENLKKEMIDCLIVKLPFSDKDQIEKMVNQCVDGIQKHLKDISSLMLYLQVRAYLIAQCQIALSNQAQIDIPALIDGVNKCKSTFIASICTDQSPQSTKSLAELLQEFKASDFNSKLNYLFEIEDKLKKLTVSQMTDDLLEEISAVEVTLKKFLITSSNNNINPFVNNLLEIFFKKIHFEHHLASEKNNKEPLSNDKVIGFFTRHKDIIDLAIQKAELIAQGSSWIKLSLPEWMALQDYAKLANYTIVNDELLALQASKSSSALRAITEPLNNIMITDTLFSKVKISTINFFIKCQILFQKFMPEENKRPKGPDL